MDLNTLKTYEEKTMASLKDFQCATVEKIDELFRSGQNRVLVADEVGLGKTLIARGVIAKTAIIQYENDDDIFKIVYICSNQVIANQNIRKLDVFNVRPERNEDTRLSMQHLLIAQQECRSKKNKAYVQLIPLTPSTSFSMTNGGGRKEERSLMYVILKRIPELREYLQEFNAFISQGVNDWDYLVKYYDEEVQKVDDEGMGYPQNVIDAVVEFDKKHHIFEILIQHVTELKNKEKVTYSDNAVLQKLRRMFAEISVSMLQPDLVIMDEFQRFKSLIDLDSDETENGVIAKKFFETEGLKILLLSATPYKLYSTMEEIEEADSPNSYYEEFYQVFKFLLKNDKERIKDFDDKWTKYSAALRQVIKGDTTVLKLKEDAEEEMRGLMCRTERISVMDTGDYIDDRSVKKALSISSGDVRTYLDMGRMLKDIGEERTLLVDFAKSSPYLMSFMNHYKVKERVESIFKKQNEDFLKIKSEYLWLDRECMNHYDEIPSNNARLEELKKQIFQNQSELYMWVPPSRPYYNLEGVYKNSKGFSKLLVFSSWEMVPKMIGSLISYEEERRTVGVLANDENMKSGNNRYFVESKQRYPVARLRFNVSGGEPQGMYLFCLMYPSETLAEAYKPIEFLNKGYSLGDIRQELKLKIEKLIKPLGDKYERDFSREDRKWYYMAPVFLDGAEYANKWINQMLNEDEDADDTTEETGSKGFERHLRRVREFLESEDLKMGRMPRDLSSVLADMAIGSFAVCAFRANGGDAKRASELAKVFINRFNSTEATAAVILSYGNDDDAEGEGHWRKVLRYCCDGGFGAMLDEFVHMVSEGTGFGLSEDKNQQVHELMIDSLRIHTTSYVIDTFLSFRERMLGTKQQRTYMRSHFAVGFNKGDGDEAKNDKHKESLRNAFNSPMRPFVLATTSIGQEGLDFHYYCRKIMHWNLPSNPTDLEQREGRINRFKCLAIRQDLASRFADRTFVSDVWQELFAMAAQEIRTKDQPELVPYWCLGKNQNVKIERIVPMYPASKDEVNYQRLMKVLSLYRLTMGQARQEELVDYILENGMQDDELIKNLFINLSPYKQKDEEWKKKMSERIPVVEVKKKSERQMRIEKLQAEKQSLEEQVAELESKLKSLKTFEIVGMIVNHKNLGEGLTSTYDGNYITVEFGETKKLFQIPKAFENGMLTSEYGDFLENITMKKEFTKLLEELKGELDETIKELDTLVI